MSETPEPPAAVIILAAGEGTRMKSSRSKLLHEVAGRSMLSYAVDAASLLQPQHVVVVVGDKRDQVEAHLAEVAPHVTIAVQGSEAYGTGYAARCGLAGLGELSGEVLVTYADVPMLTGATLNELVAIHRDAAHAVTVLTADAPDPTGYGRVLRDEAGTVTGIVEHKDATEAQRATTEINSGIYAFDAAVLVDGLSRLTADNAQNELYLTDVLAIAAGDGRAVGAYKIDDLWQTEGVNDRLQLARMNAEVNRRILTQWMRSGVTIIDPASTWVHESVDLAPDVTLLPNVSLEGATSVGTGATVGPEVTLRDVEVGERASVVRTHAVLSIIGPDADVGPYASLRPGTELGAGGKIGTFVETKNARIGAGAKVPHQTYVGDAVIKDAANIGAGTIFANYDGVTKSTSTVGEASFVGSNSTIVAPVTVADGAYVAAGSTITGDVGIGELGVARGRQHNSDGWVAAKRSGTKTAAAAERAHEKNGDHQ